MIFEVFEDEVKMDKAWGHEGHGNEFVMKIMSCWGHCLGYGSRPGHSSSFKAFKVTFET